MSELAHLRVHRFDPAAVFEGGLLGAIERIELGHDADLLDALFVRRGPRATASKPWIWLPEAPAARSRRCWAPARARAARDHGAHAGEALGLCPAALIEALAPRSKPAPRSSLSS